VDSKAECDQLNLAHGAMALFVLVSGYVC